MNRASGNLPPGVGGGSVFDRVAPPPFPHGPPPLAPPPFPGEGLGPIVRLPNGLYGFDHLAHSDPRLAAERVPPPWERESSDRGHLNRGLPEFRRSLSRERGPLAYEGGRGDSHRLERDARHARNDGRGRSTERSPREWGRTPRGGHTGDEARRWNLEPRRSKSPQVGGERGFERERGASGRIGRVGDRRNLSPTWRNRESPSPRDRNVGAEVRKEAEKPSSEARESGGGETRFTSRLVKKEVGGRLVFEESVQRSVEERGRPQAREGREAKDRAWGTQSSKENSKRSREREERQGRGSETKREQKRGGPESSEQRVSSGGRSEQGSKGRNGVQAKYRKDEVTRGDGKADPRREAPGESNKERGNQPSSRIEEEGGPPGKGLTLVEAIRREQLKSGLVSAKHDFRKQTMSTDGGSIPNREDQGSGGEQQRTGRVASESGSGVVQSGPSPDRQEQPKPSVLTLFSQILDPGSPRQELNLLENLGARSSEERTGCLPSLAQTSLCLHVGMKVGSPKWEEGPLIATAEISASLNEPEPPGVVETFEAIFQPATQKVPPFSFLNLKQPLPDSLNQPRELVDKETQTSSAHFASPSVAKQLHALQAHPLYWLCFEEMPAKDLKRADWAADFRLGWGGGESDKVATRDGLGRGLDMGGVVADRVSVDQDAPPAERVIERGEPRTGVEAGGSESGEPSAPGSASKRDSGRAVNEPGRNTIGLQSQGGLKRDSEWLGLDETRASARPEKVARVAGDAGGDTWPKGDSQTARLLAEHHGADRESFQPDWGASRGKAGEVNASRREEEEASASRCQVLAEPVEKTSRVQEQQMSMKEEEVLKPRSPGEALGKAGVGSGPEESRGDRDDEDVPLKMLKALRSRTAADEAGAGRGPALESKQGGNGERGESPKSTLLKSTPQKERKLGVGRTGLNEQNGPGAAILHASQMKPLPSAPEELPPVALATDVIEQPVARGHVAEPSPEPDVLIEDVVIAERPGGKGASRDGRSCALCGVGPSRARGEWYCATCGTRDEACACTRPLRAHVKSRKVATKYTGAKAVVHQLCAFWTPSIYQPEDSAAYVGLTSAVIDSTGSRNSSGRQRTPVRCTYCNQVGATSRCRVESSCHSVYHYMCALAAGCRMHDCLENNNLSVACPDHFHVDTQIAKGTVARQLPWAASQGGPKRPKLAPRKSTKKAGEAKCPTAKPPVTVQARKSTVCHPGGQAAVHQTGGDEYVPEEEGEGAESEEWEGSERGFGQSPRKRSKNSPQPLKRALELSPSYGELPGTTLDNQSPGGGSKRGKKRGNRELRSILADVPKQKKLPSIEAQLEKQRDMLLKRQDVGKSKRAAIIENASLDAESVALVAELAPSLQKVMKRLAEEGANGHLGWRDRKGGVPTAERNGHLERKAEGAGPLLGPATGNPVRGSPGRLGQSGRVLGAAEIARGLLGVPKVEARSSPLPVPSTPLESTENAEPGENSDGETELVEPIGPTYDDVSSEAQTDEVTEVDEKELAEVQGGVEDLEMVNRLEEGAEMEACANELQFVCAACGVAGGRSEMERHPALPAVLCEECLESFNSANFSDRCKAGVERHCQLCGRREKARPRCDGCCKTVCQRCLERVLGPEQQRAVQDLDAWLCFSCDVAPLVALELELRRFEGRGRLEGRDNKEGVQEQNGGAVGVDQGGVGMARSGVDQKGGGQNDFGTVREGVSHGSEGHATLAIKVQTDRTEQPEERATFPLQGRNRTKVIAGAPGINEASASQNGNGPEVHACSWADCGKVFPTGPARNGHLLEHFRPCASGEEIGAGTSLSGEQLGKYSGELGTGGHSTRTESWGRRKQEEANRGAGEGESPLAAQPGFTDGRAGTEKGNGSTGKRKGSTTEGTKSEDGAEGAASQAGPGPGLAEPKARNPGTGKEEEPVFACVACGASGKRSVERQHPSLPLPVCQDCLRTIDSADFKEKDVRGSDRVCQVCGHESPTSEQRRRCGSCSCAACDRCVERLLGGRMLAGIRGGDPWLCFACHSEQLEEAKSDRGEEGLEQGADISKGSEGDVVSDPHLNGVAREKGAPGKRPREGDARAGPVEVSEPWGFCKCDACADRYTGKKDAQSPASKPLVSSPGAKTPTRKSGTRPWAAYYRVGARLIHADISGGKEKVPIPFTNDVDDDVSPLEMDYTTGLRLHPDLADFHERFAPADGCSGCCPDGADHPDAPLNQHVRDLELFEGYALRTAEDDQRVDWQRERMQGRLFYDENRLLLLPPELHPTIIECNSRCPCWPDCPNSTLQRGASVHLELFKTDNGRGFGVRTREDIQRGRLIGQYVGEVITSEEANKRSSVYLFNMDHHVRSAEQQDEVYVVDGGPASSIIRYINHSCDPNLAIYSVYTDTLHPGKPLLALYAIKDIVAGTELAYDYKYGDPGQASPGSTDGQIECRCGAKNCQKWLPDPTGIKSEHQD